MLWSNDSSEWGVTSRALFKVTDGHLQKVKAIGAWRAAAAEGHAADVVLVESDDGRTVTVSRSVDASATWRELGSLSTPTVGDVQELSVARSGANIVVAGITASGAASSVGFEVVSNDGGAKWSALHTPVGGRVTFAGGVFWLTGGTMGDKVYVSRDGLSWTAAPPPVAGPYWTAGPPEDLPGAGAAIVTTTHAEGSSTVTVWATQDAGTSWRAVASVDGPHTEFQVAMPSAINRSGHWFVIWPDGSKVVAGDVTKPSATTTTSPNGLPDGIVGAAMTPDGSLIAKAAGSACTSGKDSCVSQAALLRSEDSGQTWSALSD